MNKKVYDTEHFGNNVKAKYMSEIKGSILIVDDDQDILTAGRLLLNRHFSQIKTCSDPNTIPQLLTEHHFDAVMLDMNFSPGESSGNQGYRWLQTIIETSPQTVVVMITAHGGVDVAVEAMKLGATDFVAKPWQNEKLVATLKAAVLLSQSRHEATQLRYTNQLLTKDANNSHYQPLLTRSAAMENINSLITRTAPTDASVLILGENGTGKELVARELHRQSLRADQVFMSVDLGAMSETLFESELFGHKKGAFTGANEERMGRLQAADGGTLFLDEIGNLPLHMQAKLLTVLEKRTVTPLGTNKSIPFDVRVLAATNVSRQALTNESQFRQDLLFRLNTVELELPPLRERTEDIEPIVKHYVSYYSKKYAKPEKPISKDALASIKAYHWPGNVRALRHATERAVILSQSNALYSTDFQLNPVELTTPHVPSPNTEPSLNSAVTDESTSPNPAPELNLDKIERTTIETALKQYRYNISHTAKALGLTRAALYRRMEKHGL